MSSSTAGFRVLHATDPADRDAWIRLWEESPTRSPFAHPGVAALTAAPADEVLCAVYTGERGRVLHPVIRRRLDGGASDLTSPYGYGGALYWGAAEPEALAATFFPAFDAWARERGVVSEFVRGSLLDPVLPHPGTRHARGLIYVRELVADPEVLFAGSASKVRSNTRKARAAGLEVRIDTEGVLAADFHRIYTATMERVGSSDWYRFDRDFFSRLHRDFAGRVVHVAAVLDAEVVSIDLLLLGRTTGYYFLGGTDMTHGAVRPNDLVKTEAMAWLGTHGFTHYVLGGGVRTGDGLERYKKGFAPAGAVRFTTHERILDPQAYAARTEARRAEAARLGHGVDPGFFPAYRAPLTELADVSEPRDTTEVADAADHRDAVEPRDVSEGRTAS